MGTKFLFILFSELLVPLLQNGPPGNGGPGDRVPITGGILMLIVAAFGLGIKHFANKKKQ